MGFDFEFSRKDAIVALVSVVIVVTLALTPVFVGTSNEDVVDIQDKSFTIESGGVIDDATQSDLQDESSTAKTVDVIVDTTHSDLQEELSTIKSDNLKDETTQNDLDDEFSSTKVDLVDGTTKKDLVKPITENNEVTKMKAIGNRIEMKDKQRPKSCEAQVDDRVRRVLSSNPLIDGHNDLAMGVRDLLENNVDLLNLDHDLLSEEPWASYTYNHTDLPRLRKGMVGGVFWSAYMGCSTQYKDAIQTFLEQMDVIKQIIAKYPSDLAWADSADSIEEAHSSGRIASMIGVESGHAISSSLAVLRTLYDGGARYMTLTHTCNTPWADASPVDSGDIEENSHGLSQFGKQVILEMNRLGLMVDLSHVSRATQLDAISTSVAPVIFSHSSAFSVCHHARNVHDDVLTLLPAVGGLAMVNFNPCFLRDDCATHEATVEDIVKHINHIRAVAGVDHVGIGSDFGGINEVPGGVEDVSKFPEVFKALINDDTYDWTDEELGKLAGKNLIRVLREVEEVRDSLKMEKPINNWISKKDMGENTQCLSG